MVRRAAWWSPPDEPLGSCTGVAERQGRSPTQPHAAVRMGKATVTSFRLTVSRSGAGGLVSNEMNFVFLGSTGTSAFAVKTGQPPTEIQAPSVG